MKRTVVEPSLTSSAVIGSSDSNTVLCFVPRSCIRSPRITVTAPFANPTATWLKSSRATKAEIGNSFLWFCMPIVHKHLGPPVFFSVLSSAHTFNIGSFDRSSATVTSRAVSGICLICVIDAPGVSEAWKD